MLTEQLKSIMRTEGFKVFTTTLARFGTYFLLSFLAIGWISAPIYIITHGYHWSQLHQFLVGGIYVAATSAMIATIKYIHDAWDW